MYDPTTVQKVKSFLWGLLSLAVLVAIGVAAAKFAPWWVAGILLFIGALMAWSSAYDNLHGFPSYWMPVLLPLFFVFAICIGLFLNYHTVTVTITPPLW